MFKDLDPTLLSQLRLAVVSLIILVKEAELEILLKKNKFTAGNLSIQIQKLKDAVSGIDVISALVNNLTILKRFALITPQEPKRLKRYGKVLKTYLGTHEEEKKKKHA